MRVRVDETRKHRFSRQGDRIGGKIVAGGYDNSILTHKEALPVGEATPGIEQTGTIIHERRACCTISTSIFLVSPGVLTSPRKAMRVPFMPSSVFMRKWKPRRSTAVMTAS